MQQNEILKNLRIESGLKQKELAEKLCIGQSTIVGYEKGLHEATAEILSRYANFFNVSMDYLIGLTDEIGGTIKPNLSPTISALTDEERQLLDLFSRMDRAQKIKALGYCEGLISVKTGAHYPNFKA
ncbi:MAG: helix-turn-helix transcriptional regulator [Clostridia bacterium]|nr:helix-turn-helix transcriptional regulator [Clostridia bacterium]